MSKKILVIGGAGYIGSHMVQLLLEHKYEIVVFDNLSTGHRAFVPRGVICVKGDLRRREQIEKVFQSFSIDTVIHFSAASLVGESVQDPLKYYDNNVGSFLCLLQAMRKFNVRNIVFSSTAATYGEPKRIPIQEQDEQKPTNPYGRSKLIMEKIIEDAAQAYGSIRYIIFRYFNVAGAHPQTIVGECHHPETHLIPNILKSIKAKKQNLTIYGNDYPTKDGSCVRDYIHVWDICEAHLLAVKALQRGLKNQYFNLGSEEGYSNFDVIKVVETITKTKVIFKVGPRRPGDPAKLVASSKKARKILGWSPKYDLNDIIRTAWEWELKKL